MSPSGNSGGVYEEGTEEIPARNCFAVIVDNEPGVLARVVGLFSGRGYNIQSLTVDEVDHAGHLSRITIVTTGAPMVVNQIKAQLGRLVPVRQVVNLTQQGEFIEQCTALVKTIGPPEKRAEAGRIAASSGARLVDERDNAVIFEITGTPEKIDAFVDKMRPCGLAEVVSTGSIAMACGEPAEERKRA